MNKPTIAVDFDGVIYQRPKSERGNMVYLAPPVAGAMNFIRFLTSAFEVVIFSSRFTGERAEESIQSCKDWFLRQLHHEVLICIAQDKPRFDPQEIFDKLQFTAIKPIARVYLDDRAVKFSGQFPRIPDLLNFKTWLE